MRQLRSGWNAFEDRLKRVREKILFLDFDGTLAPIKKTPDAVKLNPATHRVLEKLARKPAFHLVIVSGRSVADLKKYFRLKKAVLVGNHGLEAQPASLGLSRAARRARKKSRFIGMVAGKLEHLFEGWPGVWVENKKYTMSLHFRNAGRERLGLLQGVIDFFRKETARMPLAWRPGKKVWEIRPSGYPGKADVVMHFLRKFPKAYPITIGDDQSDEGMFRVVAARGAAIRVGRSARSSAGYCLRSPQEVRNFLENLCRI